jgi:hypothetical protein
MAQSSKKGKKKKEVSIIKKGFDDLTTRNNYYFNAKVLYDEMVKAHLFTRQLNYNDTLPFYFHDDGTDFSTQGQALHNIIVKTGITLQRHDYARWKDDCYQLMGKAFFLKGNLDTALMTFQYVTTTMRGNYNDKKVTVSQKEILKAKVAKQKELDRLAETKKKQMERQAKEKEANMAKTIAEKEKRMDVAAKQKQKELQKRIKEKEKMLKLKAKGKYKPPTTTAKASTSTPSKESSKKTKTGSGKKAGEVLDKVMGGVSFEMKKEGSLQDAHNAVGDYRSLEAKKKASEIGNVEDSLTQKEIEKIDQLTFWEKIKHHPMRPDAIAWMTKTLIAQGAYGDAESMIAYSNTLKKLRKKDKKELGLVKSYYFYKRGYHDKAADMLQATLPHLKKKKDKAYYSYLQAQLSERSNPKAAYDSYLAVRKTNKDERLDFFALEQMRRMVKTGLIADADMEAMEKAYKTASKSKMFGDQALFALADMAFLNQDTAQSIELLKKSIAFLGGTPHQKALSYIQLGEIYYQQTLYPEAFACYDSAKGKLDKEYAYQKAFDQRHSGLKDIKEFTYTAFQQDSLLSLSEMSREELAAYVRDQNKIEQKAKRKSKFVEGEDAGFSSEGIGNNANFDMSQEKYTAKGGQWYFYNNDMRARGLNDFKQAWGERPYVNNWRRIEATRLAVAEKKAADEQALASAAPGPEAATTERPQMKIPETDEEKALAHQIIEKSCLDRGKTFFEGLNDALPALSMLETQLNQYAKGKYAPEAIYYKMLIYTEIDMTASARKMAERLTSEFPDSEWAKKLNQPKIATETVAEVSDDAEVLYASIYNNYQAGAYNEVITGRKFFLEKYAGEKKLLPKVAFLEAMAFAKIGEMSLYKRALNDIIVNYPKSPESVQAKLYLNSLLQHEKEQKEALEGEGTEKEQASEKDLPTDLFKYEDGFHFVMITIKEKKYSNAALNQGMNTLMEATFPGQRIKATNSFLDASTPMILIKRFNNIDEATLGARALLDSDDPLFKDLEMKADILLISQENFKELFTSKKLDEYKTFHKKYYQLK